MKKLLLTTIAVLTAVAGTPAMAGVTIYTDVATFNAALNAVSTEDFADTTLVSGLSYTSSNGSISNGVFNDIVSPTATTTFNFTKTMFGFGGNFDLRPGGAGLGILVTPTPGAALSTEIARTYSGGFFGFVSTTGFSSVKLSGGTQAAAGAIETYTLDNLKFSSSAVPEPRTWAMMLIGFAMVGLGLRRRTRSSDNVAVA